MNIKGKIHPVSPEFAVHRHASCETRYNILICLQMHPVVQTGIGIYKARCVPLIG